MTYAQYSIIQAVDYNNLAGGNPINVPGKVNTVWGTGATSTGYGQTPLANVAVSGTVTASAWANLLSTTANIASHQGVTITSITSPSSGQIVAYLPAILANLNNIYNNRLSTALQGTTTSYTVTTTSSWKKYAVFTHVVTFNTADQARYFFNCGGQIKITFSHPNTGLGINNMFHELADRIGTIVISSPNSGTVAISGVNYNGITKIGGGGSIPNINTNRGYFGLTVAETMIFAQNAGTAPSDYTSSKIYITAKTNGAQGSNGDNGNVITIYSVWDEAPKYGKTVSAGSTTTVTLQNPATTYLPTISWGIPTVTGSVQVHDGND